MASPNELDNTLLRSQGVLDVLERRAFLEKSGGGEPTEFEPLTDMIKRAADLAGRLVEARETEKSAFPLRARVVNLAALSLRIIEVIDRQHNLGRTP